MNDTAMPKSMLQDKVYTTRKRRRSRLRCLEDMYDNLRKMKVKEWERRMRNREDCRRIVQEVRGHPQLKRWGEGRKGGQV
jgi:hypothetical protein